MDKRPQQRPEGELIARALKRSRLSQRQAASQAELSEGHWRAIVKGYRTVSAGVEVAVRGPAETIARMAQVVGVTPDQLEEAGRADAAEELRGLLAPEPAAASSDDAASLVQDLIVQRDQLDALIQKAERILGQQETDESRRKAR